MSFLLLLLLFLPQILVAVEQPSTELNWVLKEQASAEERDKCPVNCRGVYLMPVKNKELIVEHISLNQGQSQVQLEGSFVSAINGLVFSGRNIQIKGEALEAKDLSFVIPRARWRGKSDNIFINKQSNKTVIGDVEYTYCEPDSNVWSVAASELEIFPEENIMQVYHARFKLFGIPLLYVPYFYSHIEKKRSTGLLIPSISYSSDKGGGLSVPVFFNLAPNYDVTLAPFYTTKYGAGTNIEARYRDQYHYGVWQYEVFVRDQDRYQYQILYNHANGNWGLDVDYNKASDASYYRDFYDLEDTLNKQSNTQIANFYYRDETINASLMYQGYQPLVDGEASYYEIAPRLTLDWNTSLFSWLNLNRHIDIARFSRDQKIASSDIFNKNSDGRYIQGDRIVADMQSSISLHFAGLDTRTSLLKFYRKYKLHTAIDGVNNLEPKLDINGGSLDVALRLVKEDDHNNRHHLRFRGQYLYVPYHNQDELPDFDTQQNNLSYSSLFENNRFDGGDRVGDNKRLSLGSMYVFESSGRSIFSLGIARSWYDQPRQVHLEPSVGAQIAINSSSDPRYYTYLRARSTQDSLNSLSSATALSLTYNPNKHWHIATDIIGMDQLERTHSSIAYSQESYQFELLFNYQKKHQDFIDSNQDNIVQLEEVYDLSIKDVAITSSWTYSDNIVINFAAKHHLITGYNLDASLSLEYQDCCWGFEVGYYKRALTDAMPLMQRAEPEYRQGVFFSLNIYGTNGN